MAASCANCMFYEPTSTKDSKGIEDLGAPKHGHCRRYPPVPLVVTDPRTKQNEVMQSLPTVTPAFLCGEYRPAAKAQQPQRLHVVPRPDGEVDPAS